MKEVERQYTEEAAIFCNAIKNLAMNESNLYNLESYLSMHFDVWLEKWAGTPEGIAEELSRFSEF